MRETVRGVATAVGSGSAVYVLGYVLTYLSSSTSIQESDLNQIIEAFGKDGVVWKLVGWVFYNAHGVTTTITLDIPLIGGTDVVNSIAQGDALSALLYVVPPVLLLGAGLFAARMADADELGDALVLGPAVAGGYLPLVLVGVFLFTVTVDTSSGGPTLLPAVGLAGLVYPLVFGTVGAVVAVLWR